jgi:hypothetical protein
MAEERQQRRDRRAHIEATAEARSREDFVKKRLHEIMFKHLLLRQIPDTPTTASQRIYSNVQGRIGPIPMETLLSSVGVTQCGFKQRDRHTVVDKVRLNDIRTDDIHYSIIVCEIAWGAEEVAEVKREGLKGYLWIPPKPLYMEPGCEFYSRPLSKFWNWRDPHLRTDERRFAIVCGFNRLTCWDILLRENKLLWNKYRNEERFSCMVVDISLCHVWPCPISDRPDEKYWTGKILDADDNTMATAPIRRSVNGGEPNRYNQP